ncbi:MAG: DUF262 domain-containing protein [Bacteroidaceae bacterium]|nr:DUF262 domain-containing protein [Bacteroidaceae bacterium]
MNSEISFWKFINTTEIEIPIIQRDYAQGRIGKENLRQSFIRNLKQALDNELENEKKLKFDFVYGGIKGNKTLPLDGQQRLTTLWLLHWYIAYKSNLLVGNNISNDIRRSLSKFTYETRISSREFCTCLTSKSFESNTLILNFIKKQTFGELENDDEILAKYNNNQQHIISVLTKAKDTRDFHRIKEQLLDDYLVSNIIQKQTWFHSSWNQDPTVQSMLRMLSGTKIRDKKGEDIIDGFEEAFAECKESDFKKYWDILTNDNCPIIFYHLPMNEFKLTDDLYIKMNARGKQLTEFENFKADLIGSLKSKDLDEDKNYLLDPESGFSIKMDTTWTDIFWKNRKNFQIDEIFFTFINRFFLNEMIIAKNGDKYLYTNIVEEAKFDYLYGVKRGNDRDDTIIKYESFDKYLINKDNTLDDKVFVKLYTLFENCKELNNHDITECFPDRHKQKDYIFIPTYEDDKVSSLSMTNRIIFYAICEYLIQGKIDSVSFSQWMRVVWNMVDAVNMTDSSAMVARIRRICEIAPGSHDIYNYLSNFKVDDHNGQLYEEKAKAIKILDNNQWEEKFLIAENNIFLNGSIRCLFFDDNQNEDWDDYENKLEFVKNNFIPELEKSIDPSLMQRLFKHIHKDHSFDWYWNRVFNNKKESWHFYLLNKNLSKAIHHFLLGEEGNIVRELNKTGNDSSIDYILHSLEDGPLLGYVMKCMPRAYIRWYHNHRAIYPSSEGVFLSAYRRDDFFFNNKLKIYDDNNHVGNSAFLFGNNIYFEYEQKIYVWTEHEKIHESNSNREIKDCVVADTLNLSDEDIISMLKLK